MEECYFYSKVADLDHHQMIDLISFQANRKSFKYESPFLNPDWFDIGPLLMRKSHINQLKIFL